MKHTVCIFARVDDEHQPLKIKHMNRTKLLVGIIAGGALGAALGILLAPNKGSATRKRIYDEGDNLVHKLSDKFGALIDQTIGQILSTKDKVQHVVENGKSKLLEQEARLEDKVKKTV